jgi:hypothetical protein
MILFKAGTRAFFVHGFAKNEKDNIEHEDLIAFRKLAEKCWVAWTQSYSISVFG